MRNAAHRFDLVQGSVWIREGDVLGDGSVKQKVFLHDHAEVRTKVAQAQRAQVFAINFDGPGKRMIEVHCQTDERAFA